MEESKLIHEGLSEAIIGAAMRVLNELRPGLDEKLHERALAIELRSLGHVVDQQKQFDVHYRGQLIGTLVPDMICLSYTCYVSDDESKDIFLDIQEVVRPLERQGTTRRSMQSVDTPTEEEATEQLPNDLKAVYLELQKRVSAFGTNVTTYATANNLIFRANKVFAEIPFRGRKNSLIFRVRPEGVLHGI